MTDSQLPRYQIGLRRFSERRALFPLPRTLFPLPRCPGRRDRIDLSPTLSQLAREVEAREAAARDSVSRPPEGERQSS